MPRPKDGKLAHTKNEVANEVPSRLTKAHVLEARAAKQENRAPRPHGLPLERDL